jgi:hypothetical protein
MNRSASALIRPLLRHVFQIEGSTNPILRLAKSGLILKDLYGADPSVSLAVGTIMASMRATKSLADFAYFFVRYSLFGRVGCTYHTAY